MGNWISTEGKWYSLSDQPSIAATQATAILALSQADFRTEATVKSKIDALDPKHKSMVKKDYK